MKTDHSSVAPEPGSRAERGEGRLKAILWTLVLLAAVFVAIKIVPAFVNDYQLRDKMQEEARFAVVNRYTEEQIREVVWKEIQDLDIPVKKKEEIKVENSTQRVRITVSYTVPVDLWVFKTELHFTPSVENKSLL